MLILGDPDKVQVSETGEELQANILLSLEDVLEAVNQHSNDQVTILINDTAFAVKKSILTAHPYFDQLLGGDWSESDAQLVPIHVQDHLVSYVPSFLRYIGSMVADEASEVEPFFEELLAYLQLANFFSMENVEEAIVEELSCGFRDAHINNLNAANLCGMREGPHLNTDRFFHLVGQCSDLKKLKLLLLWSKPEIVRNSPYLTNFMEKLWRGITTKDIPMILSTPNAEQFLAKELAGMVTDVAAYTSAAASALEGTDLSIQAHAKLGHPGDWITCKHWSCCGNEKRGPKCSALLRFKKRGYVSPRAPSTGLGRSVMNLVTYLAVEEPQRLQGSDWKELSEHLFRRVQAQNL
jgi:hypothetical protein